tara:strand:+ start:7785 stop:7928 length:144 start_codon:yes stop_codon:yes gene_type:complete
MMLDDIKLVDAVGKIDSALVEVQYKIDQLEEAIAKINAYIIEGESNA